MSLKARMSRAVFFKRKLASFINFQGKQGAPGPRGVQGHQASFHEILKTFFIVNTVVLFIFPKAHFTVHLLIFSRFVTKPYIEL